MKKHTPGLEIWAGQTSIVSPGEMVVEGGGGEGRDEVMKGSKEKVRAARMEGGRGVGRREEGRERVGQGGLQDG